MMNLLNQKYEACNVGTIYSLANLQLCLCSKSGRGFLTGIFQHFTTSWYSAKVSDMEIHAFDSI